MMKEEEAFFIFIGNIREKDTFDLRNYSTNRAMIKATVAARPPMSIV